MHIVYTHDNTLCTMHTLFTHTMCTTHTKRILDTCCTHCTHTLTTTSTHTHTYTSHTIHIQYAHTLHTTHYTLYALCIQPLNHCTPDVTVTSPHSWYDCVSLFLAQGSGRGTNSSVPVYAHLPFFRVSVHGCMYQVEVKETDTYCCEQHWQRCRQHG